MGYILHTPCPEVYCLRLIDEYCENYAEMLCVLVYCIGMCLRQNSGQGVCSTCLLCFRARLSIDVLLSPAGKGLTSWLLFVMSNCEGVTLPLVSWVRCGVYLYRFLILPFFLLRSEKYRQLSCSTQTRTSKRIIYKV